MNNQLIESLAKVIIAAGWADKQLTSDERNNLKDLLFRFQQAIEPRTLELANYSGLSPKTSAMFEMYTDSPVDAAERERLVSELREHIWSEEDRELVISALQSMVEADGKITLEEQAVLNEIKAKIESVDTGFFGDLGRLLGGAMQRRSEAVSSVPNRERYFEDFLKNKVYYEVRRRLDLGDRTLEIPDEQLRKLSMAGGLMARVAQVDNVVLDTERERILSLLETNWGLSREEATFVAEVAISNASAEFDYLRLSREFLEIATPAERANFLDVLFAVANADGKVSNSERKEIHNIADYLLLSSNRVEEAYIKATS
jgi:uncharacterized tellurite resistance protein B-like protein